MWWAVWWSGLALALGGAGAAAQQPDQLPSRLDEGTLNYIFAPAEERRYMPGQDIWSHILDPGRMGLPLVVRDRQEEWVGNEEREKRRLPSLSINNPMDVLRQRLMLEIARKHMREHVVRQAEENRNMLQEIGK